VNKLYSMCTGMDLGVVGACLRVWSPIQHCRYILSVANDATNCDGKA